MEHKIRRQRPVPGGRDELPATVLGEIRAAVQAEADRFHVSRSFVVAVRLAEVYGIEDQEKWETPAPKKRNKKRNRRTRT